MVKEGDALRIEKLDIEANKIVSFDQVLLVANEDGSKTVAGSPTVSGAVVKATVTAQGRADKVTVNKFKAKSRYFKRRGHRQPFTAVKIDSIAA